MHGPTTDTGATDGAEPDTANTVVGEFHGLRSKANRQLNALSQTLKAADKLRGDIEQHLKR